MKTNFHRYTSSMCYKAKHAPVRKASDQSKSIDDWMTDSCLFGGGQIRRRTSTTIRRVSWSRGVKQRWSDVPDICFRRRLPWRTHSRLI